MKNRPNKEKGATSPNLPRSISGLMIRGYRPFGDFSANFGPLQVLVGANASGKSSLFEFLRFLRDSMRQEIPPEIVPGSIGQQIFHRPGPDKFWWSVMIERNQNPPLHYDGEVMGPVGRTHVSYEHVFPWRGQSVPESHFLMQVRGGQGLARSSPGDALLTQERQIIEMRKGNQLALSTMTNAKFEVLYNLREYIGLWRFYSSFNISNQKIRNPVPIGQEPLLHEDGSNLASVLFYLMTEHREAFDTLQTLVKSAIPGFRGLSVKARGGPGTVMAFWEEEGVEGELSLADLSDGVLRFLCWAAICVHPKPPTLICIDEPDQGVHPRTLPVLAGLFKKTSERTQVLLASHASYFLTQFDIGQIAVMKKVGGESRLFTPSDSKSLMANLQEFGVEEIEALHRSDELEALS